MLDQHADVQVLTGHNLLDFEANHTFDVGCNQQVCDTAKVEIEMQADQSAQFGY